MPTPEPVADQPDASPAAAEVVHSPVAIDEATLPLAEVIPVAEPLPIPDTPPQAVESPEPGPRIVLPPTASRRLAESLILFLAAILFLRAMAVEPFGVPTGSMAPTLIGNHKVVECPRCKYRIRIGEPRKHHGGQPLTTCPNCGLTDIDASASFEIAGDRLLVDKNVFAVRSPRRWEPAVFRCPADNLDEQERKRNIPYVKRVIGLPGEKVQIIDGDVYIDGRLARKDLTQALEVRVPVFDMNYPPEPNGWGKRWVVESKLPVEKGDPDGDPTLVLAGRELHLDGTWATQLPVWIGYRHHRYDRKTDAEREEPIRDVFAYNGWNYETNSDDRRKDDGSLPVHDFIVEFDVEVVGGTGSLLCRLSDGGDQLSASLPVGNIEADGTLRLDGFGLVRSGRPTALKPGKTYHVQAALVDRRFSLAIDGKQPFASFDLEPRKDRGEVVSPFAIGVQGVNVRVRNFVIFRDIYYRSEAGAGPGHGLQEPCQLGADEYFMLGDNSANSSDSRSWVTPGVPEKNFLGKPFLLHQPSRITSWAVGGRDRMFQSIDWNRIRLLR